MHRGPRTGTAAHLLLATALSPPRHPPSDAAMPYPCQAKSAAHAICRSLNEHFSTTGLLLHACQWGCASHPPWRNSSSTSFSLIHARMPLGLSPIYGLEGYVTLPERVRFLCAFRTDSSSDRRANCGCGAFTKDKAQLNHQCPHQERLSRATEDSLSGSGMCAPLSGHLEDSSNSIEHRCFDRWDAFLATATNHSHPIQWPRSRWCTRVLCWSRWSEVIGLTTLTQMLAFFRVSFDADGGVLGNWSAEQKYLFMRAVRAYPCQEAFVTRESLMPHVMLSMRRLLRGDPPFVCDGELSESADAGRAARKLRGFQG